MTKTDLALRVVGYAAGQTAGACFKMVNTSTILMIPWNEFWLKRGAKALHFSASCLLNERCTIPYEKKMAIGQATLRAFQKMNEDIVDE